MTKKPFPVDNVRRYLEPGPIVLVSSLWKGQRNIMTMGWHTVMEFTPSLVGCVISSASHTHGLVRGSGECAINVPTTALTDEVVGIGTCSGARVDKFERFHLTPETGKIVDAPLIAECVANFECRLVDTRLIRKYDFFIFEVVSAHVAVRPRRPQTLHYRGAGEFMVAGKTLHRRQAAAL